MYDDNGNRVRQDISQPYTKQVKQRMRKLQDKLAFLEEHDYCIAYFYDNSEVFTSLEDEYVEQILQKLI